MPQVTDNEQAATEPDVPGCDLCDPSFLDRFDFAAPQKVSRQSRGPKGEVSPIKVDALGAWRSSTFERDYPTAT